MIEIEKNIANTKYDEETKKLLRIQTQRLNEEMERQQISQTDLSRRSFTSSGAISKYSSGKGLINVEHLPRIAKVLRSNDDFDQGEYRRQRRIHLQWRRCNHLYANGFNSIFIERGRSYCCPFVPLVPAHSTGFAQPHNATNRNTRYKRGDSTYRHPPKRGFGIGG